MERSRPLRFGNQPSKGPVPERIRAATVLVMREARSLELLHLGCDLLVVASALPRERGTAGTSLHDRALERLADAYSHTASAAKLRSVRVPLFQIAVAVVSNADARSLVDVEVCWFPATGAADAPPLDVLYMARTLWSPLEERSPYYRFASAFDVATRLAALPARRPSSLRTTSMVDSQSRSWLCMPRK